MLNSNSEEIPNADESSMTTKSKQGSKICKINGKYFSFNLKSYKDFSLKNEENYENVEKVRSGEGKGELPSARNPGFFKNIKKKLQIKKLMPSKSKQKVKESELSNEISRRDESLKSIALERPIEIREQIEAPKKRSYSNSVNSYIAALMFNGGNEADSERVPRFSELVAPQSNVNSTESSVKNVESGKSQEESVTVEGICSTDSELNETHQSNDIPKQVTENTDQEHQDDVLTPEAECSSISPAYSDLNKDDFERKNGTKATLAEELLKLSKHGWYWGPISGKEADSKLTSEPDGAFLVRDSSDDRYLLTLSFKSSGKLLHARMEHSGGLFSLCNHSENHGYTSVADLINHSMSCSQSSVFCYSRPRHPGHPCFPVRLTKPVSRFTQVRSLQYLCRFVIRQNTRLDNIHKLPLPKPIRGYIEEAYY